MRIKNSIERIKKYPIDRVAFVHSESTAADDKETFRLYKQGQISLALACLRMAENNGLPFVTREQFLNEYEIIGWNYYLTDEDQAMIDGYARARGGAIL